MRGGKIIMLFALVAVARAASASDSTETVMNSMRALKSSAGASWTPPAPGFTRLEGSAHSTLTKASVCAMLVLLSLLFC